MERNKIIDITRGYAMFLVVLGHAIQYANPETMDENIIFRLIYSFHMSLFMFISGLAVSYSKTEINSDWLRKRFFNLIIPFFAWGIIPFFFNKNWSVFFSSMKELLISPEHGLWFLFVLFEISCLLYLISFIKKKFNVGGVTELFFVLFIIAAVNILAFFVPIMGLHLTAWHSIFFFSGFYVLSFNKKFLNGLTVVFVLIWLTLVCFWRRIEAPLFIPYIENFTNGIVLKLISRAYRWIIPFGGIACSFVIAKVIEKFCGNKIVSLFSLIGKRSVEIYILQNFFFGIIVTSNTGLNIVINFLTAFIFSITISELCRNGKIFKILFGRLLSLKK